MAKPAGLKIFPSRNLWYVTHRPTGIPILRSLPERPTPEYLASKPFLALYNQALFGTAPATETTAKPAGPKPRWSVGYAVGFYLASEKFASLSWFTQRQRRPCLRNSASSMATRTFILSTARPS